MPSGARLMMRLSSVASCKSLASPRRRPSTLRANFSFVSLSTTSKPTSHPVAPVKVKSPPRATRR
eukprot:4946810-Alexandrium_andersonii.AAC.1